MIQILAVFITIASIAGLGIILEGATGVFSYLKASLFARGSEATPCSEGEGEESADTNE